MAGASRPVQGGAYSGARSEPGGQNTPRAGRVVASYGTYTVAAGLFAQQVDQGDIFDDAADATAIVTADGTGTESYAFADTASGTVTASGSGTESWSGPVVYTDAASGTVTASGSGTEKRIYADDATYYDNVLDLDNPVSHWKLGDPSTAVDRRGQRNLPAVSGPIATASSLVANNASNQANVFTGVVNARFDAGVGTGFGLPYEGAYTMEAWATPTADADGVLLKRTGNAFLFLANTGLGTLVQVGLSVHNSAGSSFTVVSSQVPTNQPYHIVGTYDGATAILYLNGAEAGRTTSVGTGGIRSSTTIPPWINDARGGTWSRAIVDEAAWYPTVLTAARVLAHYNAGATSVGLATPTVTASGAGAEASVYDDAGSGTVTASGSGVEAYASADGRAGTVTASGSGAEKRVYADDATYYDNVIDADNPASHWKLGDPNTAIDRKGLRNLPSFHGPISSAATLVANNASNSANTFLRASSQFFGDELTTGQGIPYNASTWSVEAWLSVPSNTGITIGVIGRDSHQAIRLNGGNSIQLRWRDAANTGDAVPIDGVIAVVGTTYHVVGVFDGTDAILYVNGIERARKAATSFPSVPDAVPTIGSLNYGTPLAFNGTIDEVGWYNGALTAARVLAHYNAGTTSVGLTTPTVTASGSGVEAYVYDDAGSGTVTADGTGVEASGSATSYTDSGSGTLTASGASVESYASADSASGAVAASGTGVEGASISDARTGTVTASGSGVEVLAFTDGASGAVTASGSGVESYAATDTGSGVATASGSGVESIAFAYVDAGSGTTTVSGSSTEAYASADSASGSAATSGSRVESYSASDATSASVTVSGAGVESYAFGDSRTATITGSGSGAESYASLDAANGVVTVTGFGVEGGALLYIDSASGTCTVSGSAGESAAFADATSGATLVSGTSTESYVAASTRMLALVI